MWGLINKNSESKINVEFWVGAGIVALTLGLTFYCQFVQFSLIIPLLVLFLGSVLYLLRKSAFKLFLHLSLLLTLIVFTAYLFKEYLHFDPLYIPVASVALLTMLLFNDLLLAFIMSLASSLLVSLIYTNRLEVMLIFFIGSLMGAIHVRDARTLGRLIGALFYIGIIQIVCAALLTVQMDDLLPRLFLSRVAMPLFVNAILSVAIVSVTLKIFEWLFGVLTNFTLSEMSDFKQPLLKEMILEAPGTYVHSMHVSNLAESAADAIGANALLARVGAYYHDIGKMQKAEYYTENQLFGGNKHDNIEPSISRLVILNHVKEGIELARKYKINPIVADFIPQHHGTSVMHYFYRKALEGAGYANEVEEENYRYPGPKPQSRETAVVMLADSVEAATRSIDEPTPNKIEEMVRKVINNKFIDGQLDECPLTLKEIEQIAHTFTRMLSALYHARVKYPDQKNNQDDRNQKSSKENNNPPSPDNQDRKKNPGA